MYKLNKQNITWAQQLHQLCFLFAFSQAQNQIFDWKWTTGWFLWHSFWLLKPFVGFVFLYDLKNARRKWALFSCLSVRKWTSSSLVVSASLYQFTGIRERADRVLSKNDRRMVSAPQILKKKKISVCVHIALNQQCGVVWVEFVLHAVCAREPVGVFLMTECAM